MFQQSFETRDLHPDADKDTGIWQLRNIVDIGDGPRGRGFALVEVRDSGAQTQVPEPSTLLLCAAGTGLALLLRARQQA